MRRSRLFTQIFPSFILLIVGAVGAISWYAFASIKQFHLEATASDLAVRAKLVGERIESVRGNLQVYATETGRWMNNRITLIDAEGNVLADSDEAPAAMDNHSDRPEIMHALKGDMGWSMRFSHTLNQDMMYVAIPYTGLSDKVAVVRVSLALTSLDRTMRGLRNKMLFSVLLVIILAGFASLAVARRISAPLEQLDQGVKQFARGDLFHRLTVSGSRELIALKDTFNHMAETLESRLATITRQHNEQKVILESIAEGVVAVDTQEHVVRLNHAAASLLDTTFEEAQGQPVQEVIRYASLQGIVRRVLNERQDFRTEVIIEKGKTRYLLVSGTTLQSSQGALAGALIVFNDITGLKQLENMRRDFVANVSHELKTPITAIKGFVDTLLDGGISDEEESVRFLEVINRHTDRLNRIIDNLLELSRIEHLAESPQTKLEVCALQPVIEGAVQLYSPKAEEKGITINTNIEPDLQLAMQPHFLELAVLNLIKNAINYSDEHSAIHVNAQIISEQLFISIADEGIGIPSEHISRLFQRFYRVDQARSRDLGGTGLGLALVKHIALLHKGRIEVESAPGKGSTFRLILPV